MAGLTDQTDMLYLSLRNDLSDWGGISSQIRPDVQPGLEGICESGGLSAVHGGLHRYSQARSTLLFLFDF